MPRDAQAVARPGGGRWRVRPTRRGGPRADGEAGAGVGEGVAGVGAGMVGVAGVAGVAGAVGAVGVGVPTSTLQWWRIRGRRW